MNADKVEKLKQFFEIAVFLYRYISLHHRRLFLVSIRVVPR